MCDDVELSERRGRVKWSQDPRNVFWSSDKSKFGFRMLEKMGWVEGKGLGANEDGMKQHVKVSVKKDNLGVGAVKSQSDEWIAQRESYESLLANLNGFTEPNDHECVKDLTSTANRSRKLTYRKFLKSKNLCLKSDEDMNCVLGKRKREKDDEEEVVNESFHDGSGIPTVTSSVSLNEYFSLKKNEFAQQEKRSSAVQSVAGPLDKCKLKSKVSKSKVKRQKKKKAKST